LYLSHQAVPLEATDDFIQLSLFSASMTLRSSGNAMDSTSLRRRLPQLANPSGADAKYPRDLF
jgi:hypothetical protein